MASMPDPPPGQHEFDLPPELWEQIFAHLNGQTLLSARLVCHRWRAIADRKRSLWAKMRHRFHYGLQLDEQFARDRWTPATSIRLNGSKILLVESSWWVPLGERLTDINLLCCKVTLETLLGMLRRTPNLERLSLYMVLVDCEEEPVGDFQLLKMREFHVRADSTFGVFGEVFPRLSSLILELGCSGQEQSCRLIQLVQGTLKRLRFRATKYLALNMSLMNRLQLQHLNVVGSYEVAALYLCHVQPSIEELIMPKVDAPNSMLCLIGTKLPRLRQLETGLAEVETILTPSFLATMPHLKKLSLTASLNKQLINFTQYKCTNLNELYLNCLQPVENSLQAFLSGSHLCKPPSVDESTLQTLWRLLPLLTRLVHCKKRSGCCRLFKLC
ncbi:uncharacterized protein LOC120420222 [Culex pipiens pallens]|uniref:uncharacterized protein LOC120420222 n=1 Tax=Culex pipiens pallens TaxID=42434 RepID=UPI001954E55B|nr:uncharacterized protein LOC120420222 [Culex pipiens pallens]